MVLVSLPFPKLAVRQDVQLQEQTTASRTRSLLSSEADLRVAMVNVDQLLMEFTFPALVARTREEDLLRERETGLLVRLTSKIVVESRWNAETGIFPIAFSMPKQNAPPTLAYSYTVTIIAGNHGLLARRQAKFTCFL